MKYGIILLASLLFFSVTRSQDLQTAKDHLNKKDYPSAKKAMQLAHRGTTAKTADFWLVEYRIDSALGMNKQYNNTHPQALAEAAAALLQIAAVSKSEEILLKAFGLDYLQPFNDCYTGLISKGSEAMNAQNAKAAFTHFKAALSLSAYFYRQQLVSNAIDTSLCFYAGYTAMQAEDKNNAETYFKILTDNNCAGADINIAYGWLCNYYLQDKKDIANAKQVCEKGLRHYPADEYLNTKWKDILAAAGNTTALIEAYEKSLANGKGTFTDYLGYAAWLYDHIYIDNAGKPADPKLLLRLGELIKESVRLNSQSAPASYLAGMYHSNLAIEQNNTYSKTPSESLKKQVDENVQAAILHLEKAAALYEEIKNSTAAQKEHCKTALLQLVNLYKFTRQTAKQETAAAKAAKL